MTALRVKLAIVAQLDFEMHQMDVKTAFLYGSSREVIYMFQPKGYVVQEEESKVCQMLCAFYRLKES